MISHFTRTSSTATTKKRTTEDKDDDNEEKVSKQRNIEASPEECDQAVEGLSLVKAKAKQVQEFLKKDEAFIKKNWAIMLGIGHYNIFHAFIEACKWKESFTEREAAAN